jgi:hypothetical protein
VPSPGLQKTFQQDLMGIKGLFCYQKLASHKKIEEKLKYHFFHIFCCPASRSHSASIPMHTKISRHRAEGQVSLDTFPKGKKAGGYVDYVCKTYFAMHRLSFFYLEDCDWVDFPICLVWSTRPLTNCWTWVLSLMYSSLNWDSVRANLFSSSDSWNAVRTGSLEQGKAELELSHIVKFGNLWISAEVDRIDAKTFKFFPGPRISGW